MKVSELATLLRGLRQDAEVVVRTERGGHLCRPATFSRGLADRRPDGDMCEHHAGCEQPGDDVIDVVVVG
jgi:hypothetical protein